MYGAFKVCVYSFLVFLTLAVLLVCVAYVIAVVSGSTSGFKKEAAKKHHHLDLNTLGGHTDCITVLDFSSDACNLSTGDPFLKAIRGDTLSAAQQYDLPIVMNLLNIKQHQARFLFIFHRWKIDCILRKKLEKASNFTNAEKLKVRYTSRTRIRRATTGEGI
ncbi:hypothetical protein ZWY2020_014661 [Hordeum vulgare]|nr:hypothetical protein ZWY2020_014661 [Hordeum vulgare]